MKRMGVVGSLLVLLASGCLGMEDPSSGQQPTDGVAREGTARSMTGGGDDGALICESVLAGYGCGEGDGEVVDDGEEAQASAAEILRFAVADPIAFHAALETAFPGYSYTTGEGLRTYLLGDGAVEEMIAWSVQGRGLSANSEAGRVLDAVGHRLEKSLVGQDAPGDEGAIFAIAIGLELQGIDSSLDTQIQDLKDQSDDYSETTVDLFGWVRRSYRWVRSQLSDAYSLARRSLSRIDWSCVAQTAGVGITCVGCVAAAAASPETAGGTVPLAQQLCGAGCVSGALSVIASGSCRL